MAEFQKHDHHREAEAILGSKPYLKLVALIKESGESSAHLWAEDTQWHNLWSLNTSSMEVDRVPAGHRMPDQEKYLQAHDLRSQFPQIPMKRFNLEAFLRIGDEVREVLAKATNPNEMDSTMMMQREEFRHILEAAKRNSTTSSL